jgi:membrane associated rhomboid family serine protease
MTETYRIQNRRKLFNLNLTILLIIVNVLVFFFLWILQAAAPNLNFDSYLALTPSLIIQGKYLWTLLTSMFIHANFFHLFFNMISLFFLGTLVERLIGRKRFLWSYLIFGIFAGLFFAVLSGLFGYGLIGAKIFGDPTIMGVGASGAIFGLVGILTILIPKSKVYLVAGPLIAIIFQAVFEALFPTSSLVNLISIVITFYVFLSIFSIISFNPKTRAIAIPVEMPFWILPIVSIIPLIIIGLFVTLPIGNTAHLGGFMAGIVYGLYLKSKYKNKTKYLRKVFS